mmetsp:Transcript_16917/g.23932  ORF Transcript_16917/g.23932 Transcript_16917/m.23932 type:complete len:223 (+) Transcript_16917:829-1497(+)
MPIIHSSFHPHQDQPNLIYVSYPVNPSIICKYPIPFMLLTIINHNHNHNHNHNPKHSIGMQDILLHNELMSIEYSNYPWNRIHMNMNMNMNIIINIMIMMMIKNMKSSNPFSPNPKQSYQPHPITNGTSSLVVPSKCSTYRQCNKLHLFSRVHMTLRPFAVDDAIDPIPLSHFHVSTFIIHPYIIPTTLDQITIIIKTAITITTTTTTIKITTTTYCHVVLQ